MIPPVSFALWLFLLLDTLMMALLLILTYFNIENTVIGNILFNRLVAMKEEG